MQLVIAEKPSVARNIAKVLHATNVKDGYLEGKEYLVSWCIGHLIELASADQYRDDWKRLRLSMNTTRRQRKQICLQRYGPGR